MLKRDAPDLIAENCSRRNARATDWGGHHLSLPQIPSGVEELAIHGDVPKRRGACTHSLLPYSKAIDVCYTPGMSFTLIAGVAQDRSRHPAPADRSGDVDQEWKLNPDITTFASTR